MEIRVIVVDDPGGGCSKSIVWDWYHFDVEPKIGDIVNLAEVDGEKMSESDDMIVLTRRHVQRGQCMEFNVTVRSKRQIERERALSRRARFSKDAHV